MVGHDGRIDSLAISLRGWALDLALQSRQHQASAARVDEVIAMVRAGTYHPEARSTAGAMLLGGRLLATT